MAKKLAARVLFVGLHDEVIDAVESDLAKEGFGEGIVEVHGVPEMKDVIRNTFIDDHPDRVFVYFPGGSNQREIDAMLPDGARSGLYSQDMKEGDPAYRVFMKVVKSDVEGYGRAQREAREGYE